MNSDVMWHWLLMSSVAATARMRGARAVSAGVAARLGRSRRMVALLGVALSCSSESLASTAGVGGGRRHGFGEVARCALPVGAGGSASGSVVGAKAADVPALLVASGAMPPFSCLQLRGTTTASHNKSVNTDPHLQEAASPQWWWSGYLQRYEALASRASEGKGNTSSRLR